MWVQHPDSLAIGRASESKGSIVKRATSVAVQATAVAGIPTAISIVHSWMRKGGSLTKSLLRTRLLVVDHSLQYCQLVQNGGALE